MSIVSTSRGVTVHWNGPPLRLTSCDGSRCARTWSNIRAWQMRNGWNDVAYNFGVCPGCGTVHTGRGWGARSGANGTSAGNRDWHAVMVMSGEGEPFTDLAKVRLLELHGEHRRQYGRSRLTTHRAVRGGTTACPGTTIIRWVTSGAPSPQLEDDVTEEQMQRLLSAIGAAGANRDARALQAKAVWDHLDPHSERNTLFMLRNGWRLSAQAAKQDPAAFARAVAEELSDDQAAQVVDELSKRLAGR